MYTFYIKDANDDYVMNIEHVFKDFGTLCFWVEDKIEDFCEDDGDEDKVDAITRDNLWKKVDKGHDVLYYESPTMGYKFMIRKLKYNE